MGDEKVIAHDLDAAACRLGEGPHGRRIVLRERVFDRHNGVGVEPAQPHGVQLLGGERTILEREQVAPAAMELRGRRVERDGDVGAGLEARVADCADQRFESFLVRPEGRPPAAFVGHALQGAVLLQARTGRAIHLGDPFQAFGEAAGAGADDHVILDVHPAARVRAAAVDLHLGHRHCHALVAGQVLPQRLARRRGRGLDAGQGHCDEGVGAKARLVRRAVQRDQLAVHRSLVARVHPEQGGADRRIHVAHRDGGIQALRFARASRGS